MRLAMTDRIKLHHGQQYHFQLRRQVVVLTGTFWFNEDGMRFAVPNGEYRGFKDYLVFRPSDCQRVWPVEEPVPIGNGP